MDLLIGPSGSLLSHPLEAAGKETEQALLVSKKHTAVTTDLPVTLN